MCRRACRRRQPMRRRRSSTTRRPRSSSSRITRRSSTSSSRSTASSSSTARCAAAERARAASDAEADATRHVHLSRPARAAAAAVWLCPAACCAGAAVRRPAARRAAGHAGAAGRGAGCGGEASHSGCYRSAAAWGPEGAAAAAAGCAAARAAERGERGRGWLQEIGEPKEARAQKGARHHRRRRQALKARSCSARRCSGTAATRCRAVWRVGARALAAWLRPTDDGGALSGAVRCGRLRGARRGLRLPRRGGMPERYVTYRLPADLRASLRR